MKESTVQFGINQMGNPTPNGVKTAYRALMGVTAIWAIVSPNFPEIGAHAMDVINRLCIVGVPTLYGVCQMFGWQKPE